jgi:hypothetical protein
MFRKSLAAFAALVAAFAVGAPVASAAITNHPLTAVETDRSVTFSYTVPAGTSQSAVLVDFDSDGVSDHAISANVDYVDGHGAYGATTLDSTDACQQYWGPDRWEDAWSYPITVTSVGGGDVITIDTDGDDRLRTAFTAKAVAFGEDFEDVCEQGLDADDNPIDTLRVATDMSGVSSFDFTPVPPAAPTGLKAAAGNGQVELSWAPVADAENYNIIVDGEPVHFWYYDTTFTVGDLVNGRQYSFQVEARNADGTSVRSAAVLATPQAPVVTPPVNPQPPVHPTDPKTPVNPTDPKTPVNPTDKDGDGIRNDWLVHGKPAAAPSKPKARRTTSKSVTVKLPKASKGTKIAVYFRTGKGKFVKAKGKVTKKHELTIKGLKKNTAYEIKTVKVKGGKQSAASKPIKVKTKKK